LAGKLIKMKVSVVIPVYNSENTINNCLESVKKQTFKDYEIFIVNDGSTDNSESIIKKFIDDNQSLDITLICQNNKGVSSARNLGIKNSNFEIIAFLDSDDQWYTDKLEKQIQILKKNNTIYLLGANRNGEKFKSFWFKKINNMLTMIEPKDLLYKMFFFTSTVIVKKEVFLHIGYFDESKSYCEDGDLFIRIAEKYNCCFFNVSLVNYGEGKSYFGDKGLSSKLWEMQMGEINNIKYLYSNKAINILEYLFVLFYSFLKFLRRVLITLNKKK
jgi:glycosyltransferase involved in cell wall biosynthesis